MHLPPNTGASSLRRGCGRTGLQAPSPQCRAGGGGGGAGRLCGGRRILFPAPPARVTLTPHAGYALNSGPRRAGPNCSVLGMTSDPPAVRAILMGVTQRGAAGRSGLAPAGGQTDLLYVRSKARARDAGPASYPGAGRVTWKQAGRPGRGPGSPADACSFPLAMRWREQACLRKGAAPAPWRGSRPSAGLLTLAPSPLIYAPRWQS